MLLTQNLKLKLDAWGIFEGVFSAFLYIYALFLLLQKNMVMVNCSIHHATKSWELYADCTLKSLELLHLYL